MLFRSLKLPKAASLHSHPLTDVRKRLGHVNPHVTATVYAHALPGKDDLAELGLRRPLGPPTRFLRPKTFP